MLKRSDLPTGRWVLSSSAPFPSFVLFVCYSLTFNPSHRAVFACSVHEHFTNGLPRVFQRTGRWWFPEQPAVRVHFPVFANGARFSGPPGVHRDVALFFLHGFTCLPVTFFQYT